MDKVYLVTTGDGEDGSEWGVESIHRTMEGAIKAKRLYESPRVTPDGREYSLLANDIEVWSVYE